MKAPGEHTEGFIPTHGGYRNLITFQKAEIIYDGTVFFYIAEASMASATSKETEIKLTNVARASLEELLPDYEDFLRTHKLTQWGRNHRLSQRFDELNKTPNETFKKAIEHKDAEISANVLRCLTKVTVYLLGV